MLRIFERATNVKLFFSLFLTLRLVEKFDICQVYSARNRAGKSNYAPANSEIHRLYRRKNYRKTAKLTKQAIKKAAPNTFLSSATPLICRITSKITFAFRKLADNLLLPHSQ